MPPSSGKACGLLLSWRMGWVTAEGICRLLRADSYYNGDSLPYTGPGATYDYAAMGGQKAATTTG